MIDHDREISFTLINILEPLKNYANRSSKIYYPINYLVLYCTMNISFVIKKYRDHEAFCGILRQIEEKF